MCQVQMLRALVNQRLTAAVEEIFVVLERTIAEYEEELSRTKEENERQRQLLDAVFRKQEVVLHTADASRGHPREEWSVMVDQEDPQPPHIKEEWEEPQPPHIKEEREEPQPPLIQEEAKAHRQEGERLEGLELFLRIGVPEDDEDDGEGEEKIEAEPPSSSSSQHLTTEADGDHCGGPADKLPAPDGRSASDMASDPPGPSYWKCAYCDKSFHHRGSLQRHMRNHTGEKGFICSVCGKGFSLKAYLIAHTRTHTGEKPFTCSVCGKRFSQKAHLRTHAKIHTREKPSSCSVSGMAFIQNGDLRRQTTGLAGGKPS
uniref:zinc finger protein 316-like isoform X2 n=1 Tax=Doryrhamphus excisus TaxID=161450 RepID=UPI0025ADF408|nr:zinc finger protein 316-like isoform X2 [Doryrhamphus excisus]